MFSVEFRDQGEFAFVAAFRNILETGSERISSAEELANVAWQTSMGKAAKTAQD